MVEGKNYLYFSQSMPFELPNALLIAACILNGSNLIMHLIVLAQMG